MNARTDNRLARGLVLGKFMPLHRGHVYLIEFARRCVDQLTVVVDCIADQPLAVAQRVDWIERTCPGVRVVGLADPTPQEPDEHPEFWAVWRRTLRAAAPYGIDDLFASEDYGARLAAELGARFVPVDPQRDAWPISGTAVRADPLSHWSFLPPAVRAWYAVRVSIFGPESTGKSTLARRLADHYRTLAVHEYARTWLEAHDARLNESDMPIIARGQAAAEDALAEHCNRVLFCDTDPLLTEVWSHALYRRCNSQITALAALRSYELTLLTDVDVPWVADAVRYLPNEREAFLDRCETALKRAGRRYLRLSGAWEQRFESARAAIDRLVAGSS